MALDFLTPQILAFNLGTCLLFFLLLASFCSPFIALFTERLFASRSKVFYDKCAHQIARMALWVGFFAVGLFIVFVLALGLGFEPDLFSRPLLTPLAAFICLPVIYLVLAGAYLFSWDRLRSVRGLHILIGLLASLAALASVMALLLLLYAMQFPLQEFSETASLAEIARTLAGNALDDPSSWMFLAHSAVTGLGAAGAFSLIWLILRRNKDDFGRDYYVFATHYCARWAFFSTLLGLLAAVGLTYYLRDTAPPELGQALPPLLYGLEYGLPFLACVLWLLIIKSATPLRHRPGAVLACLLLFSAMFAQLTCFTTIIPLP